MIRHIISTLFVICISLTAAHAQTIGGIGAQLVLDTTGGYTMPRIFSLVQRSPAYDSLRATDYIIKVNDVSCKNKTIEEVVALIRGVVGTTVKITTADTKEGARPRDYHLPRVSIQLAAPADPTAAFFESCENEVRAMKQKGTRIIKTFNSDCGNYFFNFNAETPTYHVYLYTMSDKGANNGKGYQLTAKIFDSNDEQKGVMLTPYAGPATTLSPQLEGTIVFKQAGVGTVGITVQDGAEKCKAMYIVIFK